MKKLLLFAVLILCSFLLNAQGINISNTSPVTENFDGMSTGTTLPSNWKVAQSTSSPVYSTASTSVTQQTSSGSPTTGGTYNWGATSSERAIGAMTSGSFSSPNSVLAYYTNTGSTNITQLAVSYDIERYRRNTATASVEFYYSTDGSTWTSVSSGDVSSGSLATGSSTYGFNPPQLVVNVS